MKPYRPNLAALPRDLRDQLAADPGRALAVLERVVATPGADPGVRELARVMIGQIRAIAAREGVVTG